MDVYFNVEVRIRDVPQALLLYYFNIEIRHPHFVAVSPLLGSLARSAGPSPVGWRLSLSVCRRDWADLCYLSETTHGMYVLYSQGGMIRLEPLIELNLLNSLLFELIPLFKLDKQFPVERFEATVSQSTVPSPLFYILPRARHGAMVSPQAAILSPQGAAICMCTCMCIYIIYIYIYIHILFYLERERDRHIYIYIYRERERERCILVVYIFV